MLPCIYIYMHMHAAEPALLSHDVWRKPQLALWPLYFCMAKGLVALKIQRGVAWYGTGYKAPRLVVLRSFTLYTRCLLGCRSRGFVLCQQAAASGLSDSTTLTISVVVIVINKSM